MNARYTGGLPCSHQFYGAENCVFRAVVDPKLSLLACRREDNGAMWMLENLLELPGSA